MPVKIEKQTLARRIYEEILSSPYVFIKFLKMLNFTCMYFLPHYLPKPKIASTSPNYFKKYHPRIWRRNKWRYRDIDSSLDVHITPRLDHLSRRPSERGSFGAIHPVLFDLLSTRPHVLRYPYSFMAEICSTWTQTQLPETRKCWNFSFMHISFSDVLYKKADIEKRGTMN